MYLIYVMEKSVSLQASSQFMTLKHIVKATLLYSWEIFAEIMHSALKSVVVWSSI